MFVVKLVVEAQSSRRRTTRIVVTLIHVTACSLNPDSWKIELFDHHWGFPKGQIFSCSTTRQKLSAKSREREREKDRDGAIKTIWESRFPKNNKSIDRVDATTGRKGLGAGAVVPV